MKRLSTHQKKVLETLYKGASLVVITPYAGSTNSQHPHCSIEDKDGNVFIIKYRTYFVLNTLGCLQRTDESEEGFYKVYKVSSLGERLHKLIEEGRL